MFVVGTTEGFALIFESREDLINALMMLKETLKRPPEAYPAVLMSSNGHMPPNDIAAATRTLKEAFGHALRGLPVNPNVPTRPQ